MKVMQIVLCYECMAIVQCTVCTVLCGGVSVCGGRVRMSLLRGCNKDC